MDLLPEPSRNGPEADKRNRKHRPAHEGSNGVDNEEDSEKDADPNESCNCLAFTHTARFRADVLENKRMKLGFRGVESKSTRFLPMIYV